MDTAYRTDPVESEGPVGDEGAYWVPPSNEVQATKNTIDGYRHGALAALAKDAPQNSADAKAPGAHDSVEVEFELHERRLENAPLWILTVTDRSTTGLTGPALTPHDLQVRAEHL